MNDEPKPIEGEIGPVDGVLIDERPLPQIDMHDALAAAYNRATPREQKEMDNTVAMARARAQASPRGLLRMLPWIATRKPLKAKENP